MGIRLNLLCNGQIAKNEKFRNSYEMIWPCGDEIGRNLMEKDDCGKPSRKTKGDERPIKVAS